MAVTTTNLGVITAYGDAVAAGYTGTKAEWQALMASYATVAEDANEAKNAAVSAKNTAVAKATEATTAAATANTAKDTATSKATEATTAANTATTKAGEASASAQSIAQSASQIAQNTSDISELKEDFNESFEFDLELNLFDINNTNNKNGYGLTSAEGAEVVNSSYWITGFLPIPSTINLVFNSAPTKVCYYDSSKNFLRTSSTGNVYYTIPTDAPPSFFRVQYPISSVPYNSKTLVIIGSDGTKQRIEQTTANRNLNLDYVNVEFPKYDELSRIMKTSDFWEYADWEIGSISSSTGNNTDNSLKYINRLKTFVKLFIGCVITSKTGYRFKIFKYDEFGNFLSTNAWVNNGSWTVDETGYYRLIFGTYPVDASYEISETDYENLVCQGQISELLYPTAKYTGVVTGEKIVLAEQEYYTELINATIPSHSPKSLQGFDIYDGKVFQLYSLNKLSIFNLSDGAEQSYTDITCDHGNSCQFTNVFNAEGDAYPLLCCFAYDNDLVYLNKINADGTTELVKTYSLAEIGAYRHSGGISKDGKRLYSISYHQNSSTDDTDNYCVIAIWDLENSTELNGVLKPVLVKQTKCYFIPIIQGCKYHFGKLFVSSGNYPDWTIPTSVYVIDTDGNTISRINDFPTGIYNRECEGVSIYNGNLILEVTSGLYRIVLE